MSRETAIARTTRMLAHDVRKPFSLVRMILDMLQSAETTEELHEIARQALPEVDQALTTVTGMIEDVMQIGTKGVFALQPVEAASLIRRAVEEVARICPDANISFEYHLEHTGALRADERRAQRVLANVIANGFQAMKKKGRMWFRTRDLPGDRVELAIGNDGPLIPSADLPQIFDAFFTSSKPGGTGLGLAIAKQFMAQHGGDIAVTSTEETGTEFRLTFVRSDAPSGAADALPARAADVSSRFVRRREESARSSGPATELEDEFLRTVNGRPQRLRLLVVDDEPLYRNALVAEIPAAIRPHIDVFTASCASEALDWMARHAPDLVILDVDLGPTDVNGIELLREMRRRGFEGHVSMHSNRALALDYRQALEAGASTVLPKPISRVHLTKLLRDSACQSSARLGERDLGGAGVPRPLEGVAADGQGRSAMGVGVSVHDERL